MATTITPIAFAKRVAWNRVFTFDLSSWAERVNGQTIASATISQVSPPDGALTLAAPTFTASAVLVRISGGTAGQSYNLVINGHWSDGSSIIDYPLTCSVQ